MSVYVESPYQGFAILGWPMVCRYDDGSASLATARGPVTVLDYRTIEVGGQRIECDRVGLLTLETVREAA